MTSIRNSLLATVARVGIALGVAAVTGPLATLYLFQDDVKSQIAANHAARNAPLVRVIEARDDNTLTANRSLRGQLEARLASVEMSIAALRESTGGGAAEPPAIREQAALVSRLADDKAAADRELIEAEALVTDELAGIPGANRSGRPGEGPRYTAAVTKRDQAKGRATAASAALVEAQDRLRQLRDAAATQVESASADAAARLKALLAEREAAQADLARFDAEYQALVAGRSQRIVDALAADPARVPEEAGLTARLSALWQISLAHPENLVMLIGLHVVFVGLELVVMLSIGRIARVPTYSASQAFDEKASSLAVYKELERLYAEMGMPTGPAGPAGPSASAVAEPEPEPPPPPATPPAAAAAAVAETELEDGRSALARYFMATRTDARRLEDEEAEAEAERRTRLEETGLAPTIEATVVKRGRGRPRGSRTRNRTLPPQGHAGIETSAANPSGDDGARQREAEKEKEEV